MNIYSVDKGYMKILSFKYEKANGSVSNRVVLEMQDVTKHVQAIDLTELEVEDQASFAAEVSKLMDVFKAGLAKLEDEYDVKNRYRQFDPAKMSDIQKDWV